VLLVAPFAAGALTLLLQLACPLYVSGKGSGFCNYQGADLLGGWVSGVIVAFLVDAAFVAGLLFVSAWQVRRSDARHVVKDGGPRAQLPSCFDGARVILDARGTQMCPVVGMSEPQGSPLRFHADRGARVSRVGLECDSEERTFPAGA
jgi:hypothetical protein